VLWILSPAPGIRLPVGEPVLLARGVHKLNLVASPRSWAAWGARSVLRGSVGVPSSEVVCARIARLRSGLPCSGVRRAAWPRRPIDGAGDRRSAARAGDPAASGGAAAARAARPARAVGVELRAAAPLLARVRGHAGDAVALAPAAGRAPLDVPAQAAGSAAARSDRACADRAARAREQSLGVRSDRGRAAKS